ncbi:uncharacterized protein LOC117285702 [Fukomys damarensis]|uniref:uncharacterized protein LOC117285702 n=1 Tax=Fukomys damarensis TaxID=885580 RepID=UPI001455D184|nr:uncharacterized protein LOC117285702 [Fukomys damarensis]
MPAGDAGWRPPPERPPLCPQRHTVPAPRGEGSGVGWTGQDLVGCCNRFVQSLHSPLYTLRGIRVGYREPASTRKMRYKRERDFLLSCSLAKAESSAFADASSEKGRGRDKGAGEEEEEKEEKVKSLPGEPFACATKTLGAGERPGDPGLRCPQRAQRQGSGASSRKRLPRAALTTPAPRQPPRHYVSRSVAQSSLEATVLLPERHYPPFL